MTQSAMWSHRTATQSLKAVPTATQRGLPVQALPAPVKTFRTPDILLIGCPEEGYGLCRVIGKMFSGVAWPDTLPACALDK